MSVEVKAQNDTALASVKAIYDAADRANTLLGQMEAAATAASTTLTAIYADAENAKTWANGALSGLSTLESLIDTVQWIADHKKASTDVTVDPDKTYYTYDSATGTLSKVDPVGTENPSQEGWYELDEAITNYIASRLVEANEGLYVADIGNGWKVLVSSGAVQSYAAGVHIIDPNGYAVLAATAGGVALNAAYKQRIGGTNNYIEFDPATGYLNIIGSGVYFGTTPVDDIATQEAIDALESAVTETTDAISETISETQDSVSSLQETVSAQGSTLSAVQSTSNANSQNIAANSSAISSLQGGQTTINNNISSIRSTVSDIGDVIENIGKGVQVNPSDPSVLVFADQSSVKVTSARVVIRGAGNSVAWGDGESFNAQKGVFTEIRPRTITISGSTATLSGNLVFIARNNGHVSLKKVT